MLLDLECEKLNQKAEMVFDDPIINELKMANTEAEKLHNHNKMLLNAVWLAYKKHHLGDDSIGWEELSDKMGNVLAEVMGDDDFCSALDDIKALRENKTT